MALCANILNDVSIVAEIKPATFESYNDAIKGTLLAFDRSSGVPAKTQLEILNALGQLGDAVKDHLVSAANSAHYPVRSRAIAMLVPHLPDDDLFSMQHILRDRSQVTIRTYLSSLPDRDPSRTERMLLSETRLGEKAGNAIIRLFHRFAERHQADELTSFVSSILEKLPTHSYYAPSALVRYVVGYFRFEPVCEWLIQHAKENHNASVRQTVLEILADRRKEEDSTWELIREGATEDSVGYVRRRALELLADRRKEEDSTWELIREGATEDNDGYVRRRALELLADRRKEEDSTWELIRERATEDNDGYVRRRALELFANRRKEEDSTWELIRERATEDDDGGAYFNVRETALGLLVDHYAIDSRAKIILSLDFDGMGPFVDPKDPIRQHWVDQCATRLNISTGEVWVMFKQLSELLPLKLEISGQ